MPAQTTGHRPASAAAAWVVATMLLVFCATGGRADPRPRPGPSPWPSPAPSPVAAPEPGVVVINGPTTTSYSDEMCRPPTVHPSDPLPPCVDIENIEALCYPNGTAPLYLAAHAQCMCRGSFFPEWDACRRCLSLHGQLSDRDLAYYEAVASAASSSLCGFLTPGGPVTTTPTAIFKDLFSSAEARLPEPTTGVATSLGPDEARNNTDVSLYYTPSGPRGPGAITGSATSATATGLALATGHPPPLPTPTAVVPPGASSSDTSASASPATSQDTAVKSAASHYRWAAATVVVVSAALVSGLLV